MIDAPVAGASDRSSVVVPALAAGPARPERASAATDAARAKRRRRCMVSPFLVQTTYLAASSKGAKFAQTLLPSVDVRAKVRVPDPRGRSRSSPAGKRWRSGGPKARALLAFLVRAATRPSPASGSWTSSGANSLRRRSPPSCACTSRSCARRWGRTPGHPSAGVRVGRTGGELDGWRFERGARRGAHFRRREMRQRRHGCLAGARTLAGTRARDVSGDRGPHGGQPPRGDADNRARGAAGGRPRAGAARAAFRSSSGSSPSSRTAERPRSQLMLALYRCGRQAEALALYRMTARVLLARSSALHPGPELRARASGRS